MHQNAWIDVNGFTMYIICKNHIVHLSMFSHFNFHN